MRIAQSIRPFRVIRNSSTKMALPFMRVHKFSKETHLSNESVGVCINVVMVKLNWNNWRNSNKKKPPKSTEIPLEKDFFKWHLILHYAPKKNPHKTY